MDKTRNHLVANLIERTIRGIKMNEPELDFSRAILERVSYESTGTPRSSLESTGQNRLRRIRNELPRVRCIPNDHFALTR